jgi:Domain of unknown function (DUF932)
MDRMLTFFGVECDRDEVPADVFPMGVAPFIRKAEEGSRNRQVVDGAFGLLQGDVIEGAFRVLDDFEAVDASTEAMKGRQLNDGEQCTFATAALALRYGQPVEGRAAAPITTEQLVEAHRPEDAGSSLWTTFQRVQ